MRVPLDFDWPLDKVWKGYQLTEEERERWAEDDCPDCERGYAPRATYLHEQWYGKVPFRPEDNGSTPFTADTPEVRAFAERNVRRDPWFYVGHGADEVAIERAIMREAHRLLGHWNGMWSHHLNQADVDALIEGGRLMDFTHRVETGKGWQPTEPTPVVTAEQVNRWSLAGFGHDAINAMIVIKARCEREGELYACPTCDGQASLERFPGQRDEAEKWERTDPPTGEGWQLWETVSEGSPISPVFDTAEGLAQWLASPAYRWGAGRPMRIDQARAFVNGPGWAPSFMGDANGVQDGTTWVADRELAKGES